MANHGLLCFCGWCEGTGRQSKLAIDDPRIGTYRITCDVCNGEGVLPDTHADHSASVKLWDKYPNRYTQIIKRRSVKVA